MGFEFNFSGVLRYDFWPVENETQNLCLIRAIRPNLRHLRTRPTNGKKDAFERCFFFQNWNSQVSFFSSSYECIYQAPRKANSIRHLFDQPTTQLVFIIASKILLKAAKHPKLTSFERVFFRNWNFQAGTFIIPSFQITCTRIKLLKRRLLKGIICLSSLQLSHFS